MERKRARLQQEAIWQLRYAIAVLRDTGDEDIISHADELDKLTHELAFAWRIFPFPNSRGTVGDYVSMKFRRSFKWPEIRPEHLKKRGIAHPAFFSKFPTKR